MDREKHCVRSSQEMHLPPLVPVVVLFVLLIYIYIHNVGPSKARRVRSQLWNSLPLPRRLCEILRIVDPRARSTYRRYIGRRELQSVVSLHETGHESKLLVCRPLFVLVVVAIAVVIVVVHDEGDDEDHDGS